MSSALPTSNSNVLGGLGFLGCNQKSESLESPAAARADSPANCDASVDSSADGEHQVDEVQIATNSPSAELPAKVVVRYDSGTRPDSKSCEQNTFSEDATSTDDISRRKQEPYVGDRTKVAVADAGPFHRVARVRENQGLTQRTIAKRMRVDIRTLRHLESPTTDLTLSQLLAFQKALDVPLVDLLEDRQDLSRPVEERAKLVKIMKTATAMQKKGTPAQMKRMADTLREQLVDLMPELEEVSSWPQFGARRGQTAVGRALSQQINMSDLSMD